MSKPSNPHSSNSSSSSSSSSNNNNSSSGSESQKMSSISRSKPTNEMEQLLQDIAAKKYKKIIVMAGAGISTAAGIPDFRSPHTGLYANLQKYNLPYPEAVFDIEYLRENPEPFYLLASEMFPTQFRPTRFHEFLHWLSELGCLKRVYTQNIDTLERLAGVPPDLIVEAHGSFASSHCIDCKLEAPAEEVEKTILQQKGVPRCEACYGLVKPDIVFFGEGLPERFFECIETDFDDVDLAIVAGTSLQVGPFNQLPDMVPKNVPRYLMNMERVGTLGRRKYDKLVLGPLSDLDPLFDMYIPEKESSEEDVKEEEEGGETPSEVTPKDTQAKKSELAQQGKERLAEEEATETKTESVESLVENITKLHV